MPTPRDMARGTIHRILTAIPLRQRRSLLYFRAHRRWPNLSNPRTFTEKINWRILHDRRPIIGRVCGKLETKELVAGVVATPRTYWSGHDIAALASVRLPDRWVLKPNHSSGSVYFGHGPADPSELRKATRGWLKPGVPVTYLGEWGYSTAANLLLVEERLGATVDPPPDLKFFVFDGVPYAVQVDTNRFTGHTRRFYDVTDGGWAPLPYRNTAPLGPIQDRPAKLDDMMRISSQLGAEFDFIRIDLYLVDGEIYLGELTPYDGSGLEGFDPPDFDEVLGARWTLPTDLS